MSNMHKKNPRLKEIEQKPKPVHTGPNAPVVEYRLGRFRLQSSFIDSMTYPVWQQFVSRFVPIFVQIDKKKVFHWIAFSPLFEPHKNPDKPPPEYKINVKVKFSDEKDELLSCDITAEKLKTSHIIIPKGVIMDPKG
jgi:hypothetical protein